jgi:hypothetical protein
MYSQASDLDLPGTAAYSIFCTIPYCTTASRCGKVKLELSYKGLQL